MQSEVSGPPPPLSALRVSGSMYAYAPLLTYFYTGSGQCYKGVFGGTEIVAKVLFSQMICDDLDEFDIEVENLLKLRHPNVVRFFGVCLDADWLYIITQYVPSSLEALIHRKSFDFLFYARQLCSTIA